MFNITYLAPILLTCAGIPQTISLYKSKDSRNISKSMFLLTFFGVLILLYESIIIYNIPMIITHFFSLITLTINIILIEKYKNGRTGKI